MRGKVNFRNMSRYSDLSEKTYSRQFRKPFDFADFNQHLLQKVFLILDLDLTLIKCDPDFEALRTYGAIAPAGSG